MAALSPTSLPPSASNRTTQRTPKLHLSCDGCAASKVKCDKKRPGCDRCADNGSTCVYSPSRKFGKPSKKRYLAQQAALLPANSQNLNSSNPSSNVLTSNSSEKDSYFTTWGEYNLDQQLPPFPDLDDKFQFPLPDFTTFDPAIMTGSAVVHQEPSQLDHGQTSLDQARISTPSSDFNSQSPSGLNLIDNHCCQDTAYATLATLHCRTKEPFYSRNGDSAEASALPSPLADFPSSSSPIRPTLDKVLSTNKAVLNTLIGLLDCRCAEDPHLAMLYASILFKVLIWYQVASGIRPSSKSTSSSPSMSRSIGTLTDNGTSISTSSNFQSKGVLPTQIQVGGHILDEEDQMMLQRDLLLREVRKVGKVIDQMAASNDTDESGAASWYAVASRTLRLELQMTINKIKNMEVPSGQS